MARGADHEHVAKPWSKMISAATRLSAQPNTTAVGCCAGKTCSVLDALTGMLRRTGDEPLVTLFECHPCLGRGAFDAWPTLCTAIAGLAKCSLEAK